MIAQSIVRRLLLGAATIVALAVAGIAVPVAAGALTPAMAQSADDMAAALDAYGHWTRDPRYGDVWAPDGVPPDWRPYEYGHWVYTDDWGWYWVSDETEEDFGWVVYHYGRWLHDRGSWFWVPGDQWAPAWVDWRYGGDTVGWAPLPPDGVDVDAYEADPVYWVFVPDRYITAPRLRSYYVPRERRAFFLRGTRIVNRTLATRGARIAVNPGISPAFVARVTHAALPTYRVRPRVFGSTQGVSGAVQVRPEDLRKRRGGPGGPAPHLNAVSVQRTNAVIKVDAAVTAPKPLGKGESGQLGSHPPRAAQGGVVPQQQLLPQQPAHPAPIGTPPRTGAPPIQHPGPAPAVVPAPAPAQPKVLEERREVHPPAGAGGPPPQPAVVQPALHPAPPPPPPPAVHVAPPPPPPVHAPAPPPPAAVRAPSPPPPPVVHAPPPPPPPVVHAAPPPPRPAAPPPPRPAPKPGEKPPEPPK